MRISDWSSDVCSSDLAVADRPADRKGTAGKGQRGRDAQRRALVADAVGLRRIGGRMCEAEVGAVRDIAAIGVEAARVGADIDVRRPAPRSAPITARTPIAHDHAIVAAIQFHPRWRTGTYAPDERKTKDRVYP